MELLFFHGHETPPSGFTQAQNSVMRSYSTVVYPSAVILTDRFAMAALCFSIGNWHQRQIHAAFRVMLY